MKVLCCGSREMPQTQWNIKEATRVLSQYQVQTIIEGGARGADTVWRMAGSSISAQVLTFPADWNKYGRSAGPIRNQQMLEEKPDLVLAFKPKNADLTRGTGDMVNRALKAGIKVIICEYEGDK